MGTNYNGAESMDYSTQRPVAGMPRSDAQKFYGGGTTPPSIDGVGFNLATIDAPTTGATYASFPATCSTRDGSLIVIWRASTYHNFSTNGQAGKLYMSRSLDGVTWTPKQILFDETPTYDLRDPCLYRDPDTDRIYLTFTKFSVGSNNLPGVFISHSDDGGYTFNTPKQVLPSVSSGSSIRKMSDGTWRWPIFEERTNNVYKAVLLTAVDPLGVWTKQATIYEEGEAASVSESDIVEISPTNWVAVVRRDGGPQAVAVQSIDKGATWSAGTVLPGALIYQGWPTFIKLANGRVLLFARASGLRVIELVDQAQPLVASSWKEPGVNGIFGTYLVASGGGFVGKFVPIENGDTICGAYMAETTNLTVSEIRFGGLSKSSLNTWTSHIQTAEKTPDGSAINYYALPTPDTVTFWTPGGMHRIEYQSRSYQASGTVSTYQQDIEIDGELQGNAAQWWLHITGTAVGSANVSYPPSGRWGYKWLPRGLHTVTVKVRQDSFTVGRTFTDRTLSVTLIS